MLRFFRLFVGLTVILSQAETTVVRATPEGIAQAKADYLNCSFYIVA